MSIKHIKTTTTKFNPLKLPVHPRTVSRALTARQSSVGHYVLTTVNNACNLISIYQ